MTIIELYQQARDLTPVERKQLIQLLQSMDDEMVSVDTWTEAELEELMKIEPLTGAEIVAAGLTGTWENQGIEDGLEWVNQQRQKRQSKYQW